MTKIESMRKAIQEAGELLRKNRGYDLDSGELLELAGAVASSFYAAANGYRYGFIKGIRYQKAREKEKRRKAVKV